MCFGTAALDTDTFQRAIVYQNELGHLTPLSGDMIILFVGQIDLEL